MTSAHAHQVSSIKSKYSKTQILDAIAAATGLSRKQVASVLDRLGEIIEAHVKMNAVIDPPSRKVRCRRRGVRWNASKRSSPQYLNLRSSSSSP